MDNLLVVGDMMVDTDVYVTQDGYCRETGCSRMVEHSKVERLGGAGNAALLAAYLKVAGAVSLVSPGFWPNPGKLSHKVERGDVPFWWHQLRGSEYPTRTRYVDLATNKVVLRLDSNPNPETAYDCVGEADSLIISQKIVGAPEPQFARMLISDYGRMPTPLHKGLRDSLPKVVVANVKDLLADRWKWLPPRTVGVCNRYELLKAYQRLRDTAGYNVPQMVSVVGKEWGRNLVVTCGEDGVYQYNNRSGTVYLWPVPRVTETPQIVGAGDMFSAAFTVKLSHHADIQDVEDTAFAIRYGIAAASVYVRSERGAKITDGECRSALDQYHLARVRCGLGDLAADVTSPTISDRPIVFTNGCFDLLHAGHRQLLAQCVKDPATRALVVAVNTDESVRSLKGSERPVRSIHSRVMDVAYAIDPKVRVKVMAFDGNVTAAIRSLGMRPAELVKGDEYAGQDIPGAELCDTVTLYPMVEGHSTSRLVGR